MAKFDDALLDYIRMRSEPNFFFDPAKTSSIGSFIANNNISYTDQLAFRSRHEFAPLSRAEQQQRLHSEAAQEHQLDGSDRERQSGVRSHAEPARILREMAWVTAITGNTKYVTEVEYELASWGSSFRRSKAPAAWPRGEPGGVVAR